MTCLMLTVIVFGNKIPKKFAITEKMPIFALA